MARSIDEWVAPDDTKIPNRVKTRVAKRAKFCCQACGVRITRGGEIDHVIALENWNPTPQKPNGNRETNLQLLCKPCHGIKTAKDVAEKSKVNRVIKRMGPLSKEKTYWAKQYAIAKKAGWNPWGKKP
jgi:5-methylcytosine-specific restriction endonuclease McrA